MKIRRRILGVIAVLALARLSLSGVAFSCASGSESQSTHQAHGSSVAVAVGEVDGPPTCDGDTLTRCDLAGGDSCLEMAACVVAALASSTSALPTGPAAHPGVLLALRDTPVGPDLVPDPPPPRV